MFSRRIVRSLWSLVAACLALVLSLPALADQPQSAPAVPAVAATPPERLSFAVVIGNNKSLGNRRAELHYADDDAARYFEILQTMAPGRVALLADFDRDTQRLFPTARAAATTPSLRNLQAVGKRLAEQVRAARAAGHETDVYFIFAGHGDVLEGEGFIELAEARFRARDLTAWLGAIPFSRAHVILDSCNSFFMLGARKPGGRHFATSEDASRALAARLPNVGVFLSTSADGEAFEWSEIQSGIFSHVVRSGLLGGADANGDGQVSYVELAAFVDTATSDVRNPNMRPHVFARGPGAQGTAAIANLQSMTAVRRFALGEAGSLRMRLRDANGLPLVDAHSEHAQNLRLAVPESWARGAVLERVVGGVATALYGVPEPPGTVTLAGLEPIAATSAGRGPGETFEPLFSRPFGPSALREYQAAEREKPPAVFGVSREDTLRMQLLLDQLASVERGKRISESIGGLGFGALMTGAGVGLLHVDANASRGDKREARILGGSLLGLGGVMLIGGTGSLMATGKSEAAADEFRRAIRGGQDSTQAFAHADEVVQKLIKARGEERMAQGIIGTIVIVGCATGLTLGEIATHGGGNRMGRRLGWGGGMLGGAMMLGDAIWMEQPVDSLGRIWREDPSLNQYQTPKLKPAFSVGSDGAFVSLSGSL
jgi:Caspase domain